MKSFGAAVRHEQDDLLAAHLRLFERFESPDPSGESAHLFLSEDLASSAACSSAATRTSTSSISIALLA